MASDIISLAQLRPRQTGLFRFTFRWRLVGCMYCPSVRQSTPASRSSVTPTHRRAQKTAQTVCVCVRLQLLHTPQSVDDLLLRLPQSQHDGGLGEHAGLDRFGVSEDAQRLVQVRSGVTDVPGDRLYSSVAGKTGLKSNKFNWNTFILTQPNVICCHLLVRVGYSPHF